VDIAEPMISPPAQFWTGLLTTGAENRRVTQTGSLRSAIMRSISASANAVSKR
jgi:hypothetical protein